MEKNFSFGKFMKALRDSQGWSLEEMAEKLGTTKQALSRYERGERSPMLSAAVHFSEVLGISIEEMCGMNPPKRLSVPDMLTPDESDLITTFRSLSSEGQRLMLATAQSFATNPAYQKNTDDQAI